MKKRILLQYFGADLRTEKGSKTVLFHSTDDVANSWMVNSIQIERHFT